MLGVLEQIFIVVLNVLSAYAYIPAAASNDTEKAITAGLNVTDISKLNLHWYSKGFYSENVSFQLAGNGSTGYSKGALVHFSEEEVNNSTAPTLTPWIALVSCDRNATNMSLGEDIFTLARDKGAVAAVLYSLTSKACIINPAYADPTSFDQVFDIFSTQSLTSAKLIEYQFGQFATLPNSLYFYDSKRLNDSQGVIFQSMKIDDAASPGFLYAVLRAYNATASLQDPSISNGAPSTSSPPSSGSTTSSALAMVVLYSITGCVSALFIIVIVSGAVRALRHPERYGPRAHQGDNGAPPQSRARGLTRAIIDTFPLVKFGAQAGNAPEIPREKDLENSQTESATGSERASHLRYASFSYEGYPAVSGSGSTASADPQASRRTTDYFLPSPATGREANSMISTLVSRGQGESSSRNISTTSLHRDDVVPAQIGRETCPICIVDFEEGDDIRVLPCDGKHCFHQHCVDPWLLKLSSSCPICRHDFLALENIIAGTSDTEFDEQPGEDHQTLQPPRLQNGRFSRYLRFARLQQRRQGASTRDSTIRPRSTRDSVIPSRGPRESIMIASGPSTVPDIIALY